MISYLVGHEKQVIIWYRLKSIHVMYLVSYVTTLFSCVIHASL